MAKLAVLVIMVYAVYFGSLKMARTEDVAEGDEGVEGLEDDGERRSGSARARVRVSIGPSQLPYTPSIQPSPPSPVYARSVECYVCTDCPTVLPNTTTKLCPKSWDGTKDKSCVTYVEKYNHMKKPWYIRGCASERGNCEDVRQAHSGHAEIVRLSSCHECIGDKCNTNGASRSLSDITMGFVVLIITPLVAKQMMS